MNDEFDFINKIKPTIRHQSTLITGIGDDAAVYATEAGFHEVVCVDTMVEGVHFLKSTLKPYHIGYKAVAVNVSDLAAMGAKPLYYLVSIAIPSTWSEHELLEIYDGMNEISKTYSMDLIGGDTVSTKDKLVITVTVIGRVEKGVQLLRSQAKPGDVVFVTGMVGGSSGGLDLLLEKTWDNPFTDSEKALVQAHQLPNPQIEAGRIFAACARRMALNDISDGVASEAHEIADSSKVKITIVAEQLPIHTSLRGLDFELQLKKALYGGEDFQLIGAISQEDWPLIQKQCTEQSIRISKVGFVEEGDGVCLEHNGDVISIQKEGYNHFTKR